MKQLYINLRLIPLYFVGIIAFSFSSCNGNEEKTTTDDVASTIDYSEYEGKSLEDYEIPVLIMLPDQSSNVGASIEPDIIHTDGDFKWEINIGPNFTLLIEDFGKEKDIIKNEKERLSRIKFYKVEYLEDSDSLLFYKRILNYKNNSNNNVGVDHDSYHCFGVKKINGYNYVFKSNEEGSHKPIIETMIKTIKSVEKL